MAYLNSTRAEAWLEPSALDFRGGFYKFEPRNIASIPVPSALIESEEAQAELSELIRLGTQGSDDTNDAIESLLDRLLGH